MSYSRNQLREDPTLARLHEFIKSCNANGSLTRQACPFTHTRNKSLIWRMVPASDGPQAILALRSPRGTHESERLAIALDDCT